MRRAALILSALALTACELKVDTDLDELTADGGPLAPRSIWDDVPEPVLDRLLGDEDEPAAPAEQPPPAPDVGPWCWSAPSFTVAYVADGLPEVLEFVPTEGPPGFWPNGKHMWRMRWQGAAPMTDYTTLATQCLRDDCTDIELTMGLREVIGPRIWTGYRMWVEAHGFDDGTWNLRIDYGDDALMDIELNARREVTLLRRYEAYDHPETGTRLARVMDVEHVVGTWSSGCAYSLSHRPD